MGTEKEIHYYQTYTDDFVFSKNQDFQLPEDYLWVNETKGHQLLEKILLKVAGVFANIYCRVFLHAKVVNKKVLRQCKEEGIFLFGNHTQEVGDVFLPKLLCGGKRYFAIASAANLGIPVIGKLLPWLGALPIPNDFRKMKDFKQAVYKRIEEKKCIVIYPEAHVWPYCTWIRPFPATSFHYPVESKTPSYAMTTTYQKRKWGKKPKISIYVDGPFYAEEGLSKKQQREKLRDTVYGVMKDRSQNSNYDYMIYKLKGRE